MSTVIKVENLSKMYRLGVVGTGTLTHDLNRWWHQVRGKEDPYLKVGEENDRTKKGGDYSWALRDINFEVKQGEVLGIIGKNGAGKSTLLKILSRVTQPTTGSVKVKGRIASLLEVGTGFHPELTGRENIFLNGAILGMTKAETRSKFDEIVDFSGVERYIDTPVKRYSSGMYVRLAFSVAAHLEPEILIVDEVLAVGDAEFQQKCLGKMQDVAGQGRTVIFVSHNMAAVSNLCSKGILLKNGSLKCSGAVDFVLDKYLEETRGKEKKAFLSERIDRKGNGWVRFYDVEMRDGNNKKPLNILQSGRDVSFLFKFKRENSIIISNFRLDIGLNDNRGERISWFSTDLFHLNEKDLRSSESVEVNVKKLPLMPGEYSFTLYCMVNGVVADWVSEAYSFTVEEGDFYNSGKLNISRNGSFLIDHNFIY